MKMQRKSLVIATSLALATFSYNCFAGTASSGDVALSITLTGACSIDVASVDLVKTYTLGAADLSNQAMGSVSINCTSGQTYYWGINGGTHYATGNRYMQLDASNEFIYSIELTGDVAVGDKGIAAIDGSYTDTTTTQLYVSPGDGTGVAQVTNLLFDAAINGATVAGTYTDTVQFVVAW